MLLERVLKFSLHINGGQMGFVPNSFSLGLDMISVVINGNMFRVQTHKKATCRPMVKLNVLIKPIYSLYVNYIILYMFN